MAYSLRNPPPSSPSSSSQSIDVATWCTTRVGVRRRLRLDRLDVAVRGQPRVGPDVEPVVSVDRPDRLFLGNLDDPLGGPDAPLVQRAASSIGGGASAGLPRGAPAPTQRSDGGDLLIRQRRILLEGADTDVALDEPRRHLALGGPVANGARPGPDLGVGQQRHRRYRSGSVALLAGALQDGQHVLRERRLRRRRSAPPPGLPRRTEPAPTTAAMIAGANGEAHA